MADSIIRLPSISVRSLEPISNYDMDDKVICSFIYEVDNEVSRVEFLRRNLGYRLEEMLQEIVVRRGRVIDLNSEIIP